MRNLSSCNTKVPCIPLFKFATAVTLALLVSCGGGGSGGSGGGGATTYSLGGTLTGLAAGDSITLSNGTDNLTLSVDGAFTMPAKLANGAAYDITLSATTPAAQPCTSTSAASVIHAANVTQINVICGIESPGGFAPSGNLANVRFSHTATLLNNGKVLVIGGFNGTTLGSGELFDPAGNAGVGTWSLTGILLTPRYYHTATLLQDGNVLVTGGNDTSGSPLASSELYDPAHPGITNLPPTGDMNTARVYHTATLLPDGKVLVTGGEDATHTILDSSELFDPATGTWTATTGHMITARERHSATLLNDGKVLVTGGLGSAGILASSELYDPATETWTATGDMHTSRDQQTATLLADGKVLVTGGFNSGVVLASSELYDPAGNAGLGSWSATGSMITARNLHTATLLPDGKVLVTGGQDALAAPLASSELYDPAGNAGLGSWSASGSLAAARDQHTATLLANGKVLVTGGWNGASSLASSELYDPTAGAWTATGILNTEREYHTATLLPDGQVLVTGGNDTSGSALASSELYDPAAGTWSATGALITARRFHTATLLADGKVLVTGGGYGYGSSGSEASSELYDPAAGTWAATGSLITAREYHTATLLPDGKVLVTGGSSDGTNTLASSELYDPATGTWAATGSLITTREYYTATLLPDGKVLVTGGSSDGTNSLASSELYDPATGTWAATGSMITAREYHTATLLPDGKVLVTGGFGTAGLTASSELYDPATGTWSATGSMLMTNAYHSATLLPTGKVMVVGGGVDSSELYDPATGTWSVNGSVITARYYHTTTLLPNGKLLVTGGLSGSGILASSELYW